MSGRVSVDDASLVVFFDLVCVQEPTLFSSTIAENIRYGIVDAESASDEQVWEAARMANADVFIRQFPNGLNTLVGERGIMLSGE